MTFTLTGFNAWKLWRWKPKTCFVNAPWHKCKVVEKSKTKGSGEFRELVNQRLSQSLSWGKARKACAEIAERIMESSKVDARSKAGRNKKLQTGKQSQRLEDPQLSVLNSAAQPGMAFLPKWLKGTLFTLDTYVHGGSQRLSREFLREAVSTSLVHKHFLS